MVCGSYKLLPSITEDELENKISDVVLNNKIIMTAVSKGTEKLGLQINEDETMTSSGFLSYDKVPIF